MNQETSPSRYSLFYADIAARVLQNLAAGTRMDCRDIAKEAAVRGWIEARDRFCSENFSTHISMEIEKQESQGLTPRFVTHGKGIFSLRVEEAFDAHLTKTGRIETLVGSSSITASATSKATANMSFSDAAKRVLEDLAPGQTMHCEEITARAIEQGWIRTKGKTPSRTMSSSLGLDNRRRIQQGENPFFVSHGKGTFSLYAGTEFNYNSGRSESGSSSETPTAIPNMKYADAAEKVLEKLANRHPMHYQEITAKAIEHGWLAPKSKKPQDPMHKSMSIEIGKSSDKANSSRFYKGDPGYFGLSRWLSGPAQPKQLGTPDGRETDSSEEILTGETSMSFAEAAKRVLEDLSSGSNMHYRDITAKAIEKGWIRTKGKTPEGSMSSILGLDIRRRESLGEPPLFVAMGKGLYGLSQPDKSGMGSRITEHNNRVRNELRVQMRDIDPEGFEQLVGQLLNVMGFVDIEVTNYSGDGGIDVRGILVVGGVMHTRMAIQAKRQKSNVGAPVVQQVRGSLGVHEQGLIITTGGFTKKARREALEPARLPVSLMNGEQLLNLLITHDLGVRKTEQTFLDIDQDCDWIKKKG